MVRKGLLVVNLGTPEAPTVPAVRAFLKEFLLDPEVVDLPWLVRQLLVRGFILPFRPGQVVAGYRLIWDAETGSPLRHHTQALTEGLRAQLGADWVHVAHAMRYGQPSIESALAAFPEVDTLWVLPLYPQYADSTWRSVEQAVTAAQKRRSVRYPVVYVPPFYDSLYFIDALYAEAAPYLKPDAHWLMSFHGLPERHIQKSCDHPCLRNQACPILKHAVAHRCYRAQCWATARALAARLGLPAERYTVAFQSRVGRAPWIQPYTDAVLSELRTRGVRDLVVTAPSFVSDCLETLEELGMRLKEHWHALGGQSFHMVSAPNSAPHWVQGLGQALSAQAAALPAPLSGDFQVD